VKLGVWQDETPQGGIPAALSLIETALVEARTDGVSMLVFPECFLTGYFHPLENVPSIAEQVSQETFDTLQALADQSDVAFVVGSYEPVGNDVANTAFTFLPNEAAPLTYRKRALFGDWEKAAFTRGTKPLIFDYQDTRFAVLICFDVEFPELVREAFHLGADAILVPTALMAPEDHVADFLVPARALENNRTVAYANRIGREAHLTFIGKSQICDGNPASRLVASQSFRGLISADVRPNSEFTDYLTEAAAIEH
jgi:predicted amidohydrolase